MKVGSSTVCSWWHNSNFSKSKSVTWRGVCVCIFRFILSLFSPSLSISISLSLFLSLSSCVLSPYLRYAYRAALFLAYRFHSNWLVRMVYSFNWYGHTHILISYIISKLELFIYSCLYMYYHILVDTWSCLYASMSINLSLPSLSGNHILTKDILSLSKVIRIMFTMLLLGPVLRMSLLLEM